MVTTKLKSRIPRLERQMRREPRETAADQLLRQRLKAARKRMAQHREGEAKLTEEKEAA